MQTCVGSRGVTYGLPIRFQPALRLSEGFVIGVWIMVSGCEVRKLYAEGNAEARFKISRTKYLLYYCNVHGLFRASVR